MYKYISSDEIWDRACEKVSLPYSTKGMNDFEFRRDHGKFYLNHYNTGFGIKYTYYMATFNEDTIVGNTNSFDSSFICFNTGNDLYMEDARKHKRVMWNSDICFNGNLNEGHYSNTLFPKNQPCIIHHIGFDKNIFKELTKKNDIFKKPESIYKGDYIDVNFNNYLNTKQKLLLKDLLNISIVDDKLQMLYLESKLLDLIYTTINSTETIKSNEDIHLTSKDIECLNKAKDTLLKNMNNPPSLKELAYKSAINEFKLKKGFKQLFGNTVYGLLQEHRLNKAKKLLETNEIDILEASLMVGYKSRSHFSKIFKEHFGITPIQIKKESRSIYY